MRNIIKVLRRNLRTQKRMAVAIMGDHGKAHTRAHFMYLHYTCGA